MQQLDLFPVPEQPQPKQNRSLRVGDRIRVPTWGWQKATVIGLKPVVVRFDGREEETRLSAQNVKGVELIEDAS
ncbi:hypothetical protein [Chroococcidiopsis sp.]|uniref:hypothetical protein n=1 Tax=Chroococcidiopsis sp. TaxID=3088168 RepID=UPI003F31ED15